MPRHGRPAAPAPSPRDQELQRLLHPRFTISDVVLAEGTIRTYAAVDESAGEEVLLIANAESGIPPRTSATADEMEHMLWMRVSRESGIVVPREVAPIGTREFVVITDRPRGQPLITLSDSSFEGFPISRACELAAALWKPVHEMNRAVTHSVAIAPEHFWIDDSGAAQFNGHEHSLAIATILGGWAGLAHASPEALANAHTFQEPIEVSPSAFRSRSAKSGGQYVAVSHAYGFGRLLLWLLLGEHRLAQVMEPVLATTIKDARDDCPSDLAELVAGLLGPNVRDRQPFLDEVNDRWAAHAPDTSHSTDPSAVAGIANSLTRREHQILKLLASGFTNLEISDALTISRHTVDRHVQNLYRKLGVKGRVDATALAVRHGLIE